MLNVFLNEEYGYRHWWWEFPGDIEELIVEWNTGHAPFLGKPYVGTLTELPSQASPDNPFSSAMAGVSGSYTVHRPGEQTVEFQGNRMQDFFHATAQVDIETPYLQIGDEFFPAPGALTPEEQEVSETFQWADWTEDPEYYHRWFKEWTQSYDCGRTNKVLIDQLREGMLSPRESEILGSHIEVCIGCRSYAATKHR